MSNSKTTLQSAVAAPELLIRIDRASDEALRVQVERELREAIRAGRLPPGAELPSTRALASDVGVSRGIIVEAYEQLLAEGYLAARRGSATTVAAGRGLPARDVVERARAFGAEPAPVEFRYDFRPSVPDTGAFPRRAWHRSLRKVLATASTAALDYPDPRGALPLRTALSTYLNRVRGTAAHPAHMVMCNGFTQGFRLMCTLLKQRGARAVATEDPSHEEQRAAIRAAGLKAVAVPVDEQGLIVERLERSEAAAVLITPAHQFPTGSVLAPQRRAALLEWAKAPAGVRDRGRLRRGIPLRPRADRFTPGRRARTRGVRGLCQQDAGTRAASRLAGGARRAWPARWRESRKWRTAVHRASSSSRLRTFWNAASSTGTCDGCA